MPFCLKDCHIALSAILFLIKRSLLISPLKTNISGSFSNNLAKIECLAESQSVTYSKLNITAIEINPLARFKSGCVMARDIVLPKVRFTNTEKTVIPDKALAELSRTYLLGRVLCSLRVYRDAVYEETCKKKRHSRSAVLPDSPFDCT
jgi:hypothetical protein